MIVPPYSPPLVSSPPPVGYTPEISPGRDLKDVIQTLLKHKWLIIITFLSVFLLVAIVTFFQTPIFRSAAMIQLTPDNPGSGLSMDDKMSRMINYDELEKFQNTQYKILQSWSLAQRVVQALNLKEHPAFKDIRKGNPTITEAQIEESLVSIIMGGLEIIPLRNSYLAEVAFRSPDKALSQSVVNAIADQYMYLSIDRRNESFGLVRKWLDKQLEEMAGKVQEAQKKLYKFGQKTDIYAMEDKDNIVVHKFVDLSSLLTKAQAEKMGKEAQFQQIKEKGPNAPMIVNNSLIAQLRNQVVGQQAKLSATQKVLRRDHPDLQAEQANLAELQSRLKGEVQRLQESIKSDYEAASRTEQLLSESFAAQKEEMVKLQNHLTDFQILKRDAQTNEQLYQALLARVKEANIASTMVPSNVAVIDPARLPNSPFLPRTKRNLGLAALVGLMLGVGLALLREHLDDTIKSLVDLERACNLPSLGVMPLVASSGGIALSYPRKSEASGMWRYLPRIRSVRRSNVEVEDMDSMIQKHPQSQASEAINHLYSAIMLSTSGRPPAVVMVTSPNPKDGKTTIVSNLAQLYALNDRRVLLLDCDLRKPRLHKIYQLDPQPGLSNYLAGSVTLEEILQDTPIPNLTVATAGTKPPSPGNLLNSDVFKEMLAQLRDRFHHILIDTPPVLGFADARFVSSVVDGVLLVTKCHSTHKRAGRMALQLLSPAPLLGTILNSVGTYGQSYGSYYYYYQKYYYSYYNVPD